MELSFFNQTLVLLPEAAILVLSPSARSLVVADVHLGKSATFRAHGLPIPEGDDARDLQRLTSLIDIHRAERLVIAGDLFHARSGMDDRLNQSFETFIEGLGIPVVLVTGNHDAKLRTLPKPLIGMDCLDLDGLRVVHDPADAPPDLPSICGHWHPVIRIPDGGRTALRLPCFLWRGATLVLPAFGGFTGGSRIAPSAGDRFFTALRDKVVEVPGRLLKRTRHP
jgi:uncharacterized protein